MAAIASSNVLAQAFVSTTTTITKPTGTTTGNLILIAVGTLSQTATVTVSGFTTRVTSTSYVAGDPQRLTVLERISDNSEGASFTISTSGGCQLAALVVRVTGLDTASPYQTSAAANSNGNYIREHNFPTVTTTSANEFLLGLLSGRNALDSTTISGWTLGTSTGGLYVYTNTASSAGATGVTNFNQSTTYDLWASGVVAYNPPVSTAPITLIAGRYTRGTVRQSGIRRV